MSKECKLRENNIVELIGMINSEFRFNHEVFGEGFYMVDISVQRTSGTSDIIPLLVSDRLFDTTQNLIGQYVSVVGQYRSYNHHSEDDKSHLLLSVFVKGIEFVDEADCSVKSNQIYLEGHVCKEPIYRTTPMGREIADILLAVNRPYGKSDYIPCICWGRNAKFASGIWVGAKLSVNGRIQSRNYMKHFPDGTQEEKTVWEVSISTMKEIE